MGKVFISVGLVALLAAGAGRAGAQAVWSCAGKQVLRLHATIGDATPEKRVETLDERVNNLLSKHTTVVANEINIRRERGQVFIEAYGEVLVTVAPEDAAANKTTRDRLAHTWLTNIRVTIPQLSPRVNKHGA